MSSFKGYLERFTRERRPKVNDLDAVRKTMADEAKKALANLSSTLSVTPDCPHCGQKLSVVSDLIQVPKECSKAIILRCCGSCGTKAHTSWERNPAGVFQLVNCRKHVGILGPQNDPDQVEERQQKLLSRMEQIKSKLNLQ